MDDEPRQSRHTEMTRRKWLLLGTGSLGLLGLTAGAVGIKRMGLIEAFGTTPKRMRDHRVPDQVGARVLAVAHGSSPERNVRATLGALGGIERFVTAKDKVLIKPNIAWDRRPEQGATTDPRVVAEIVRACRAAGVERLRVLDCPVDDANRTYERTGIAQAARQAGAQVSLPEQTGYDYVALRGHRLPWPIRDTFLWADKIINVPIAKHHGSSKLTAGMKNWIGITDKNRALFHGSLHESIVALAELIRPTLTIIDATRVLMRNGPRGGNLDDVRVMNTVIASTDPVAADAFACDLLRFSRDQVKYLGLAEAAGLGHCDWKSLRYEELQLG
ncbi:MAG: DUF362 domain-containing protein [Polyangiaceae bacterium]